MTYDEEHMHIHNAHLVVRVRLRPFNWRFWKKIKGPRFEYIRVTDHLNHSKRLAHEYALMVEARNEVNSFNYNWSKHIAQEMEKQIKSVNFIRANAHVPANPAIDEWGEHAG